MGRRLLPFLCLLSLAASLWIPNALGQITPPADGVELPRAFFEVKAQHEDAFQLRRAWIQKAERARRFREQLGPAAWGKEGWGIDEQATSEAVVSGVYDIPIFAVTFAGIDDPYPVADLERTLFGPDEGSLTLSDYYEEISYGNVSTTGWVVGWQALSGDDLYYAGASNGLNPGNAKVGELIRDTLDAYDGSIDFAQYDNDGPDGLANSGDDDGYVDFVAFVHPELGGECGGDDNGNDNDNIWSHRWVYRAWAASNGIPYLTDDPAANGGTIRIDDYTIQPAWSCFGVDLPIEIGVFCHEFGHAFGLPDLYDTNGGGQGIGHWGLMSTGNWNTPSSPSHMSAWSRGEMGWASPVSVSWQGAVLTVPPIETHPIFYELAFSEDRWRRRIDCALDGSWSLAVGLTQDESFARGWAANKGYGNLWRETVAHDFHYDGSGGPVTLAFDYAKDSEPAYDYTFVLIEVDGDETLLAAYDGGGSGIASLGLAAHLGSGAKDYRIKFRFVSDYAISNEDGSWITSCAGFVMDDVSLTGGGESYAEDFETHRGGWYQPDDPQDNPPSEMWYVENRQALGSDANLHGEGLVIYHVDQDVAHSSLRNTGGAIDQSARGVAIEEADGLDQMLKGDNRGDPGDVWPGNTGKTTFDDSSVPSSHSNSGLVTRISVDGIANSGEDMIATMVAGAAPPLLGGVDPPSAVVGSGLVVITPESAMDVRYGARLRLVRDGSPEASAVVDWVDYRVVSAELDLSSLGSGLYDVVLENPDGQSAVLEDGFRVIGPVANDPVPRVPDGFGLSQNHPNPFNPSTTIRYELPVAAFARLTIHDVRGRTVRALVSEDRDPGFHHARWDGRDAAGQPVASGLYFYRLEAGGERAQRKMLLLK